MLSKEWVSDNLNFCIRLKFYQNYVTPILFPTKNRIRQIMAVCPSWWVIVRVETSIRGWRSKRNKVNILRRHKLWSGLFKSPWLCRFVNLSWIWYLNSCMGYLVFGRNAAALFFRYRRNWVCNIGYLVYFWENFHLLF